MKTRARLFVAALCCLGFSVNTPAADDPVPPDGIYDPLGLVSTKQGRVVTTLPFTFTRPSVIMSSQSRRAPMPASAMAFCRRTPEAGRWRGRVAVMRESSCSSEAAQLTLSGREDVSSLAVRQSTKVTPFADGRRSDV